MAKAVVLKTSNGVLLFGSIQCSNGAWFDAEGCYRYCQENTKALCEHQARKLIANATMLAHYPKESGEWSLHRYNFIDVEIPFEVDQTYKDLVEEV